MIEDKPDQGSSRSDDADATGICRNPSVLASSVGRRFLSVPEVCAMTGLSASTVRRLIRDRKLDTFQPGGPRSRVLIPRDAIDRFASAPAASTAPLSESPATPASGRLSGPAPRWRRAQRFHQNFSPGAIYGQEIEE